MENHTINGVEHKLNPLTGNRWKTGEWDNFDEDKYLERKTMSDALDRTKADAQKRIITRYALLSRITDEEAVAIDLASIGATVEAASLRRFISKINAAQFIDLTDPTTIRGVSFFVSLGLLTPERAGEIIDAPIKEDERL